MTRKSTVVSGIEAAWARRGPLAIALTPLSLLYRALRGIDVARQRRRIAAKGPRPIDVPIVVVGNLVAGGAGKTPTVMATVSLLRRNGFTPGMVSRGHGRRPHASNPAAEAGDSRGVAFDSQPAATDHPDIVEVTESSDAHVTGDEPLLLHLRTQAPMVVGADRVAACRELLRRHPQVDVIVCDDGLQHLALDPDVAVIVFDERGAGNGWLLPAGPLREPMPKVLAAHQLVVYNADLPSTALPGFMALRRLNGAVRLAGWWAGEPASMRVLQSLRERPMLAAAGMARPERFFAMLRSAGLKVTTLPLPDHHGFDELPWPEDTADVVVTEKDAVKLRPDAVGRTRVWVAPLDFEPEPAFAAALLARLRPRKAR
ncbi:MAG: tetraacyldisaccharide 4-kinase [Rhizobacter sp.]|nr:tetraacyldisaccharide 4-kinase [Rhizobacter sp.]